MYCKGINIYWQSEQDCRLVFIPSSDKFNSRCDRIIIAMQHCEIPKLIIFQPSEAIECMISEVKLYAAIFVEFFLSDNRQIVEEGIINTSHVNTRIP